MPAKIRAFFTSSSASEKVRKERVTPISRSLSIVKCFFSPKKLASTTAAAPLTVEWPDGYSGWFGVAKSGIHDGSELVAGLPSVLGRGIAVTGRQKT
jgi:hypothetical protein